MLGLTSEPVGQTSRYYKPTEYVFFVSKARD